MSAGIIEWGKLQWMGVCLGAIVLAWGGLSMHPGVAGESAINAKVGGTVVGCEHFAFVRAKVAEGLAGPARETCKSWHVSMCVDARGTAYAVDSENCQVYRIKDGTVRVLAADGIRGYRDGPADRARFDFGVGSYSDADIKADAHGNLYVTEGAAGRLRGIYCDEKGGWRVRTICGGGSRMPERGESIPATETRRYPVCGIRFRIGFDSVLPARRTPSVSCGL